MASRTLALVGLLEALFPRGAIALAERLAFRDRGEATLRSWTVPAARAEGLFWFLFARRGSTTTRRTLLGVVGLPMVVAPKRTLDVALALAYEESRSIAVASWVVPVTRVLGAVYVFAALRSWLRSGTAADETETPTDDES